MNEEEKNIRKSLDNLFEKAKNIEDLNEIHSLIEDYLEQGYKFRDYINKYNKLVGKFNNQ